MRLYVFYFICITKSPQKESCTLEWLPCIEASMKGEQAHFEMA